MSDKEQNEAKPVVSSVAIDDKTVADLSQAVGIKVSDFLDEKILTVSQVPQKMFKTNYTKNTDNDAEHNSGEYIVDDSQYIDIKALLQRAKKADPSALAFLRDIPTVDGSKFGYTENDPALDPEQSQAPVSVDESNELSTSEAESPQEAIEAFNPVDNTPDVSSETSGN